MPLKEKHNFVPYEMAGEMKEAIKAFIEYYNYGRYHEGLGNVTAHDVYADRHLDVLHRRKEMRY